MAGPEEAFAQAGAVLDVEKLDHGRGHTRILRVNQEHDAYPVTRFRLPPSRRACHAQGKREAGPHDQSGVEHEHRRRG